MKAKAAEILVKQLEKEGVQYLFGVPGGHLLSLYDAVSRSGGIKPILAKHEGGAGYMAYGYARTSHNLAVCCGTVGPGATNLVSGIAAAYMDSLPVLAITAQVGTSTFGKGALQEGTGRNRSIDQVGLLKNVTKYSEMVTNARALPEALRRAIKMALAGRPGPVHLDLPADVMAEDIEADILPSNSYRSLSPGGVDQELIIRAGQALLGGKKIAILAGGGCISPQASTALRKIAEHLKIPVATSLRGKGAFPEDHPLSLGCVGLYGTRAANKYLRTGLDVLMAVGVSFHEFTTHCWDPAFQPGETLIQIDIDPIEIGKNFPVTHGIVADAGVALQEMANYVQKYSRDLIDDQLTTIIKDKFQEPQQDSEEIPIKPQRLMKELSLRLPADTIMFADIGNALTWVERCYPCKESGNFVSASGLAAMGSAVAGAIGGKIGAPEKPVVCVCGDGDFQMHGMEIATAANYQIPVIWIVMNNSRLGMIADVQTVNYQGRYIAADFKQLDFGLLAEALGAKGKRIENPLDIRGALENALKENGPVVLDVVIDPEELPPLKPRMLAIRRSMGLPPISESFSWQGFKALFGMIRER